MEEELSSISIQEADSELDSEYAFKLIIIGNSSVGKSKIVTRFCENKYTEESKATVGTEFYSKSFQINNKIVKTNFWDTAGQEKFSAMTKAYYRNSHGAIIVYDITNKKSFEDVDNWIKQAKTYGGKNCALLLIGNKCDLQDKRAVPEEEALEKAKLNNAAFMETSAAESINVREAFYRIIKEIYYTNVSSEQTQSNSTEKVTSGVSLNNTTKEKSGCC